MIFFFFIFFSVSLFYFFNKKGKDQAVFFAHELQSSISATKGFLELLADPKLEKEQRKLIFLSTQKILSKMQQNLQHLLQLEKKLIRKSLFLSAFLLELLQEWERRHPDVKIHLQNEVPEQKITIHQGLFTAALLNLLENSLKYGKAPISLHIEKKRGTLLFSVCDQGSLPSFSFFKRGVSSEKGFGIGLYLTKKIVKKHKGSISAKQNKNRTVFTIKIS